MSCCTFSASSFVEDEFFEDALVDSVEDDAAEEVPDAELAAAGPADETVPDEPDNCSPSLCVAEDEPACSFLQPRPLVPGSRPEDDELSSTGSTGGAGALGNALIAVFGSGSGRLLPTETNSPFSRSVRAEFKELELDDRDSASDLDAASDCCSGLV